LTGNEGNHGEDVKEYYFYLDSTPSHSYMRMLYKYPHAAFPYADLVETARRRGKDDPEYELLDTGVFTGDRYCDVFVEYAKAEADDILIRITAANRGPERAELHLLPTLWFRNTWSWPGRVDEPRPVLRRSQSDPHVITAEHTALGRYRLSCHVGRIDGATADAPHCQPELLFTENETNLERVFGIANPQPYVKDAFHELVVAGRNGVVNPTQIGTKAAAHYRFDVPAGLPDCPGTNGRKAPRP
jgi:hypothetical protein